VKFWGTFRFEFLYQIRRPWPWLSLATLVVFAFFNTRIGILPVTLPQDFILNSPFIIAAVSVISCLVWLLVASVMAGDAAARDVQTGMHPLTYTMPVSKREYLGGRFLAVLVLNALVLLGVQLGSLLAVNLPGIDPAIIGPFRPTAYLAAYAFIALPNALLATTVQFSSALVSGRSMASYFGSVVLFFLTVPVPIFLYLVAGVPKVALLADPIGLFAIMNAMMLEWTLVEKNVRMFTLQGPMLWNRVLWLGVAVAVIALVYTRFRFAHRSAISLSPLDWVRALRGRTVAATAPASERVARARLDMVVPRVEQSFSFVTHLRQMLSIARSSCWMMVKSLAGLFLLVVYPAFIVLVLIMESEHWSIPILPRTGFIVAKYLTAPLTQASDFRMMIPLVIIYFAGELVWREREARLGENVDATSAPDWVLFLGKYLGVAFILAALMLCLTASGIVAQMIMGYFDFEVSKYLGMLFGLQLPEFLLFAALAFFVHAVVNHKYVGMLVALIAYFLIIFSSYLKIQHHLLVFGSSPAWSFTDIRGFGPTLGPWAWFKSYWAAWALLLAVATRVFWPRGKESSLGARLHVARLRLTRSTAGIGALAVVLVATLGGFIFYNTNVLNEYITSDEFTRRRAEYELQFGKYEGIPQPTRVATSLRIDIYPSRGAATIHGSYKLVNRDSVAIDSVHLEPAFYVDTRVTFDRAFTEVVTDNKLGHRIYALKDPIQPGDSATLNFDVTFQPRGFKNGGASMAVIKNGSYFTGGALPIIGYQPLRELWSADDRRKYGLTRQLTLPPPGDVDPNVTAGAPATFDAIVSTDDGQVAVAPGELRRTWNAGGRRYFHYASDVPINGTDVFFSANYLVHRERFKDVDLQLFVYPGHKKHIERFLRGARAALDYYSSQFGAYPYRYLQIVEQPGNFLGMGVDGSGVVTGGEGIFLVDPKGDGFDLIFEVAAHELGHQWWGMQLKPAFAEGGGVISEGLAWYSAMQLVRHTKGREALRRLMSFMREPSPWPQIRTGLPLLRAMDPWANYRKTPYAMYALSEYIGEPQVNGALRTLITNKMSGLATTLDMYRGLQAVTPDSLKPLLHDLFEVNAFWSFDTKKASAIKTETGAWQVTFDIEARKVVVDSAGVEKEVPMSEWVELGVFAAAEPGEVLGKTLYLEKRRINSGRQTVTITVSQKPARGGIDPYNLLDWDEGDNIEPIEVKQ
jgi:ABC-type transport system involved in multi-copper enzyme maturation permease subunit